MHPTASPNFFNLKVMFTLQLRRSNFVQLGRLKNLQILSETNRVRWGKFRRVFFYLVMIAREVV